MDSASIHMERGELSGPHSPCRRILPELLPSILSYIPIPHLHHRLVNSEWNNAMKLVHTFGHSCNDCEVRCASAQELHTRMQDLTQHSEAEHKSTPWLLHWTFNCSVGPRDLQYCEEFFIPYLDSLQPSAPISITIGFTTPPLYQIHAMVADWCLQHSNPAKFNFFYQAGDVSFESHTQYLSFMRAPFMKHVTDITINSLETETFLSFSMTPFRDLEAFSNLKSLTIRNISFGAEHAECLAESPYLTNLTHLAFKNLYYIYGWAVSDKHPFGFGALIRSPIMKNIKSLHISGCFIQDFGESKYLRNLTHLTLFAITEPGFEKLALEPLLRCDAALPNLSSLELRGMRGGWSELSAKSMETITSPSSALFNRIESLVVMDSFILNGAMEILSKSDGLRALKRLALVNAKLREEGLRHLLSAPPSHLTCLQFLDLSSNENITNASVLALYTSKSLPSLQRVDFKLCPNIMANVLKDICELPPRPNLRLLSFDFAVDNEVKLLAQDILKEVASDLELA